MNKGTLVGIALAVLAATASAEARPVVYCNFWGCYYGTHVSRAHHHRHHSRTAKHRHAATKQAARAAPPLKVADAPWVDKMRSWIGSNPTGWSHVWCARAMNMALELSGVRGTRDNRAISFSRYGMALDTPRPGAIAYGAHHVGIVLRDNGDDTVILLSGNYNHRVAVAMRYPKRRLLGYRWPRVRSA